MSAVTMEAADLYGDLLAEAVNRARANGLIFRDWQLTPDLVQLLLESGASQEDIHDWALNIRASDEILRIFYALAKT